MSTPVRRCFIHIGTHKTGTTSIQAFLADNRERLRAAGVAIPATATSGDPRFAAHHGVVHELSESATWNRAAGGFTSVMAELAASTAPVACISSEDISLLHDRPLLLTRLRDGIRAAGFEPAIVVYLRPQVSYAIAIYAANVLSGYREPLAVFLADITQRGRYVWDGGLGPPFDYAALLDTFAAVFGADAIVARRFRSDAPDGALLQSFLDILAFGRAALGDYLIPSTRANRTLTFAAVLRLLGTDNDFDEHVRFAPFTVGDLLRCWWRFARANRHLARRYGVRVPVFEPIDLARAVPIRRTLSRSRQLWQARRILRGRKHRSRAHTAASSSSRLTDRSSNPPA